MIYDDITKDNVSKFYKQEFDRYMSGANWANETRRKYYPTSKDPTPRAHDIFFIDMELLKIRKDWRTGPQKQLQIYGHYLETIKRLTYLQKAMRAYYMYEPRPKNKEVAKQYKKFIRLRKQIHANEDYSKKPRYREFMDSFIIVIDSMAGYPERRDVAVEDALMMVGYYDRYTELDIAHIEQIQNDMDISEAIKLLKKL